MHTLSKGISQSISYIYKHTPDGRLKTLKDDNGETLTAYRYTMGGRIKEITAKGDIRTTYEYDDDGNISRLTIGDGTTKGRLYDAFTLYDLNGRRLTKERYHNDSVDGAESCQYNERNELTKRTVTEDTASNTLYHYDLNGSIISEEQDGKISEYRYDLLNRQIYSYRKIPTVETD